MATFFDTHSHYTDEKLKGDPMLIPSLFAGDINHIVCVATDAADAEACLALALRFPNLYASAGLYPGENLAEYDLEAESERIEALCRNKKVVAIGEIGLDHHYDTPDRDLQKKVFRAQMALAEKVNLPVIIHDREAHADTLSVLREFPNVHGIIHSYSGSAEMVRDFISLGYYISFSGVVTYKNAAKTAEAAKIVPDDRILVETDAPYLTPVPMRGRDNNSGYIHFTAEKIAELRGADTERFAALTTENAMRIFGITE